jgi:hypothetical protein
MWDRGLHSYQMVHATQERKCAFLGRVPAHVKLLVEQELPDGSYLGYLGMAIPSETGSSNYDAATGLVNLVWPADAPGNRRLLKNIEFSLRLLDRKNTTATYQPTTGVVISGW